MAVYGSVNWDEICQLTRYPDEHEKLEALAIHSALGGSAANTATWLAPLVQGVRLIGAVGDDTEGRLCREWLDRAGVDHTCVETIAGQQTSRASCWVVGADKRIVTHREPGLRRDHAPETALTATATATHLHLGSTIDAAGRECLTAARAAGVSVSIELSGRSHDELRPHADLVFLNTEELRAVFGLALDRLDAAALAALAPKPGATAVITHGAAEVICASATDGVRRFAVTALERVIDRTGGGDAFDAGFIAGWLAGGRGLDEAVRCGLDTARQVLQQVGGARRVSASA